MCTVSFVRSSGGFILTSNRDEQMIRSRALPPEIAALNHKKVIFPKDSKAGGTWFAADEFGNIAILLNGAFKKHIPTGNYRKSRGLVLLEIIGSATPETHWGVLDLEGIEPFTVILFSAEQRLYQLFWDGKEKMEKELSADGSYIWSSVTLYNDEIILKREKWFFDYLGVIGEPDAARMQYFHSSTAPGDWENGLLINRDGVFKTLSITQAEITVGHIRMSYKDLLTQKNDQYVLPLRAPVFSNDLVRTVFQIAGA